MSAGQLIAEYQNGTTNFVHQDHLGSTRLMTALNGGVTNSMDYMPFGELTSSTAMIPVSDPSFESGTSGWVAGFWGCTSFTTSSQAHSGTSSLAQTYTYDSFGKQTASSGSLTNPFQYTGREADSETGLYFYRARYYDPAAGRFISEDPARFTESTNFYPYVGNDPSTYKDPFGQGIVDCAAELAKLAYLEGVKAKRLAENAVSSCKDPGHQKAVDQIQNAIDKQRARVERHCSDADTKKQVLLLGAVALAIALAPETGGGSLVPVLAGVF